MVTKSRNAGTKKKSTVKVDKLEVNKETVKDLSGVERKKVKGGLRPRQASAVSCAPTCDGSYTCPN